MEQGEGDGAGCFCLVFVFFLFIGANVRLFDLSPLRKVRKEEEETQRLIKNTRIREKVPLLMSTIAIALMKTSFTVPMGN